MKCFLPHFPARVNTLRTLFSGDPRQARGSRFMRLRRLMQACDNWYEPILAEMKLTRNPVMRLKNGLLFEYDRERFSLEMFIDNPYGFLSVTGKDVVDIGAYNADSSLYFAFRGARRVFAYEPFPRNFRLAKRNVELNSFRNIYLFNSAVGGKKGRISIDPGGGSSLASRAIKFDSGFEISVETLRNIIEDNHIVEALLKLDCEGCESEAILAADSMTLNRFPEMCIEYHSNPDEITRKLQQEGFEVSVVSEYSENQGLMFAQQRPIS
jgi:FkbM family methyltransferase